MNAQITYPKPFNGKSQQLILYRFDSGLDVLEIIKEFDRLDRMILYCYWGAPPQLHSDLHGLQLMPVRQHLQFYLADVNWRRRCYEGLKDLCIFNFLRPRNPLPTAWPQNAYHAETAIQFMAGLLLLMLHYAQTQNEITAWIRLLEDFQPVKTYVQVYLKHALNHGVLPLPGVLAEIRQIMAFVLKYMVCEPQPDELEFRHFCGKFWRSSRFILDFDWVLMMLTQINEAEARTWLPDVVSKLPFDLYQRLGNVLDTNPLLARVLYEEYVSKMKAFEKQNLLGIKAFMNLWLAATKICPEMWLDDDFLDALDANPSQWEEVFFQTKTKIPKSLLTLDFSEDLTRSLRDSRSVSSNLAEAILNHWCRRHFNKEYHDCLIALLSEPSLAHISLFKKLLEICPVKLEMGLIQLHQQSINDAGLQSLHSEHRYSGFDLVKIEHVMGQYRLDLVPMVNQLCQADFNWKRDTPLLIALLVLLLRKHSPERVLKFCSPALRAFLNHADQFPKGLILKNLQAQNNVKNDKNNLLSLLLMIFEGLKDPRLKFHFLRQIFEIRDSKVQKILWHCFRHESGDIKRLAALGLAMQGQSKDVKHYLVQDISWLCSKEGIDALIGIKLKAEATTLAWQMLETEGHCHWQPHGLEIPMWKAALNAIFWWDLDRRSPKMQEIWSQRPEYRERIYKLLGDTGQIPWGQKTWVHEKLKTEPIIK